MLALRYSAYGGPEVLAWDQVPEPHAGPGQIRISVQASSINPIDWKIFGGYMAGGQPLSGPAGVGRDASGIVDEVGPGVDGVEPGQEVFGLGSSTHAQQTVLDSWAVKPPQVGWAEAAALGLVGETAERGLRLAGVGRGSTVFIDGGPGGVGSVAIPMAVASGARVVASAGPGNQDYVQELGAESVLSGDGVAERVSALVGGPVDAVFDVVGKTPAAALISLVRRPDQVVTIANFTESGTGIRASGGGQDSQPAQALALVARLFANGKPTPAVRTMPREQAADAYRLSLAGHVRGKVVLVS